MKPPLNIRNDRFTLVGALQRQMRAWKELLHDYHLEDLDNYAVATTVSWKVGDKAQLFADLQAIAHDTEQVHIGTVNDRYIASAVLHEPMQDNLWIVKILERRPRSTDKLGLDSIDYLVDDLEVTYQGLRKAGLRVVKEHNDIHAWLSLRFGTGDEFEAKFTDHLVIEVAGKELGISQDKILAKLKR